MPADATRSEALRRLGLDESAGPEEIQARYWRLRAHVERRVAETEDAGLRSRRALLLSQLEAAHDPLFQPDLQTRDRRRGAPHTWVAWSLAVAALVTALGLAAGWLRDGAFEAFALGGSDGGTNGGVALITGSPPEGDTDAAESEGRAVSPALVAAPSDVAGAQLEVTGPEGDPVIAGPADERDYALPPGSYRARVSHPDCADAWESEFRVESGERRDFAPELCGETGWLVVRSNVGGDRLALDGADRGGTGPTRHALSAGEHRVRVEKPGYTPWEGLVDVEPGRETTLRARLLPRVAAAPEPENPPAPAPAPALATESQPESEGLSDTWNAQVKEWLLARFDTDRSGALDLVDEVASLPCADLRGLERSLQARGVGLPLTRFYGFDGSKWTGDRLGFHAGVRPVAYEHMRGCGLP
ncbi:MAG: PEGA domain-containing protein [Proteobacteria bacterium]|nr:PEGA domain-containing protein [Pseudomonadota bacterium]